MTIIASASATSTALMSAFFARWADMDTWPDWNTDTDTGTLVEVKVSIDGPLGAWWRRILGNGFRSSLQPGLDAVVATAVRDVTAPR